MSHPLSRSSFTSPPPAAAHARSATASTSSRRRGPGQHHWWTARRTLTRIVGGGATAAGLMVASAWPASAHGIDTSAGDRSVLGFVGVGFEHMLLGWDHLLFIAGVLLLAGGTRRAVELISLFAVGHSVTLIVATLAGWRVDPGLVDVVIVLSVVFVGAVGIAWSIRGRRPEKWRWFAGAVLVFGLIHGLGLSTRLQALDLPEDGVLWRVLAFNVGVELGQLTAIMAMLGIAAIITMIFDLDRPDRAPHAVTFGAATLLVIGAGATPLMTVAAFESDDAVEAAGPYDGTSCEVGDRSVVFPGNGGHAMNTFYGPTETSPLPEFGHSLGDGYVIVLYPQNLPADQVDALKAWEAADSVEGVLVGPAPDASTAEITATTLEQTLTCTETDTEPLTRFLENWQQAIGS